ncbi:serine-type D-Ala-D-Ala carboxypeptidase [Clostridiales bacterium oral taxon 876 str. F0540]|nr:serine-type D-Ala-D-Ala carboxypeptidase [Clostridiales bacterium oral taxon 876 str. F0540]
MKKPLYILSLIVILVLTLGSTKQFFTSEKKQIEASKDDKSKELNSSSIKNNPPISTGIDSNNKTTTPIYTNTHKESDAVNTSARVSTTASLLVNRNNRLAKDFVPKSLRIPNVKYISYADPKVKQMDIEAATALESLFDAAKSDSVTLLAVSGYRTYSYQEKLYDNKVSSAGQKEADKYVAQPGASEHQTGLAMDVLSNEYTSLDDGFDKTKAFKWLDKNCSKYGFIIRYPKDKENITGYNYEPWHIRYVGAAEASEISQKHITLEEYLDKNK